MQPFPIPDAAAGPRWTVHDRRQTAALLPFGALLDAVADAAVELQAGAIACPERMVVPLGDGGVMLSMPATARDIGVHKLVNVQPANAGRGLPTIHGIVTVFDAATGQPRLALDGPEVTGRRTAAVSLLAIRTLLGREPRHLVLVGTGVQAEHHLRAVAELWPACRVSVRGRTEAGSAAFWERWRPLHPGLAPCPPGPSRWPDDADAVVTLTTSTEPIYDEPARPGRVVVGVGAFKPQMAEIGATTLAGSDLFADDPAGARHEAGDLLRAGVDWTRVRALGALLGSPVDRARPAVFKSVGSAAWDLAAARVALRQSA